MTEYTPHVWLKNSLKESLLKCIAEVTFVKKDGEKRVMNCTLMSDYIPETDKINESVRPIPRRENDEVLAVWDIDSKGWRSFRMDSIDKVIFIGVNRV